MAVGLNLRPAIASVGPVLPATISDLRLTGAFAGALTAIPTLCMALFAPAAAVVGKRFGYRGAVLLGLAVLAFGTAMRGAGGAVVLLGATIVAGVGIGLTQATVPAALSERFAGREVMAIRFLAASISGGAIAASALSAPISRLLGSWRPALSIWAVPAALAAALWVLASPGSRPARTAPRSSSRPWAEVLTMAGLVSAVSYAYFVVLAWLVPALVAAGLSAPSAGLVLAAISAIQIPAALLLHIAIRRAGDVARSFSLWLPVAAVGLAGIGIVHSPVAIAFALPTGVGLGVLFALCLLLPVDRARDPGEAAWLAGRIFGIGYLVASAGPLVTGIARDWTGTLVPGFVGAAALLAVATSLSSRLGSWPAPAAVGGA